MSATPRFYIFHGDDLIRRGEALARMRQSMGEESDLNCSVFDGRQTTVPEIVAAVKSLPFLADRRLVIVRGLINHITRKGAGQAGKAAADRLIDELPLLPAHARLVLVEDDAISERNRVLKAARALTNGYIGEFRQPQNLTRWIQARAQDEYDAEIAERAANAVAEVVNGDLLRADSELCKLATYVDGERPINEDDVAALTPYVPEANVFEMVDALAVGNGKRALELIQQSLRDNPKDPGFGLFALIVRQFRLLIMTRDHLDRGGARHAAAIVEAVGAHRFAAAKLAAQARRFHIEQLDAILKRLQRYDQEMKTGRIEPRLALDLLVTSLAKE